MKLLRQWEQIAQVPCIATRYALATCQDVAILPKLVIAFPACFREGQDTETDRFSWRRILCAAGKYHSMENECGPPYKSLPYMWLQFLRDATLAKQDLDLAGIPVAHQWGTLWCGKGTKVPDDLYAKLAAFNGTELSGPLFLEYQQVRYVVGCMWIEYGGDNPQEGKKFSLDPQEKGVYELALVPADVIAFDC